MKKLAMFDLDGTVADTIESIASATNMVLEQLGLSPIETEKYNYFAGDGASMLVKRALIAAGDEELRHFEEANKAYQEFFKTNCTYKVRLFDGMKETLDAMKAKGMKLTVLTNKPHERAVEVIEFLFGKGYMDGIIGDQEGLRRKPEIDGAKMLMERFQVTPEECIYVGDTNVDMKTGKNAKMFTIGVLWGFRTREELEEHHADAIISKPEELLEYIY